jgi:hypothetical protein
MLTTTDHRRDRLGLRYVYPVLSRRSGGLSVGINLNPNHACNFRCIYCQVPGLQRGTAPPVDLPLLAAELRGFLAECASGGYFEREGIPADLRRIQDLALSGDGEPTTAHEFPAVARLLVECRAELARVPSQGPGPGPAGPSPGPASPGAPAVSATPPEIVLITNGSQCHRPAIQVGLATLAAAGHAACWFKLDGGRQEDLARINDTTVPLARILDNLALTARILPTWVQTCLFANNGAPPTPAARAAYLLRLTEALDAGVPLAGVLLYGLARPPQLPEGAHCARLPEAAFAPWVEGIAALGLAVRVHA